MKTRSPRIRHLPTGERSEISTRANRLTRTRLHAQIGSILSTAVLLFRLATVSSVEPDTAGRMRGRLLAGLMSFLRRQHESSNCVEHLKRKWHYAWQKTLQHMQLERLRVLLKVYPEVQEAQITQAQPKAQTSCCQYLSIKVLSIGTYFFYVQIVLR